MDPERKRRPETAAYRDLMIALAAVATFYGLVLGRRELVVCALATCSCLALLYLYARLSSRNIEVRRRSEDRAVEHAATIVSLTARNRGLLPVWSPVVFDFFTPDKAPLKRRAAEGVLRRGASVDLDYRGLCFNKRGRYNIGPVRVLGRDPLQLFEHLRRLEVAEDSLLVLPAPEPIERPPRFSLEAPAGFSPQSVDRPGRGLDIRGVRAYRPGDAAQRIHWPATARRGQLMVKDFESPVCQRVGVLFGLAQSSLRGVGRHSTHEYLINAAVALACDALNRGEALALAAFGARPVALPFAGGPARRVAVLEQLAELKAGPSEDLLPFLRDSAALMAGGGRLEVLLCQADLELEELLSLVALWRTLRLSPRLLIIDDGSFLAHRLQDLSPEAQRRALREQAEGLRALGLEVVVWSKGQPLSEAIRAPAAPRLRIRVRAREGA